MRWHKILELFSYNLQFQNEYKMIYTRQEHCLNVIKLGLTSFHLLLSDPVLCLYLQQVKCAYFTCLGMYFKLHWPNSCYLQSRGKISWVQNVMYHDFHEQLLYVLGSTFLLASDKKLAKIRILNHVDVTILYLRI